jgi:hypothetical protein
MKIFFSYTMVIRRYIYLNHHRFLMTDDSIAHAVDRVTMHFDIIMPIAIFVRSPIAVHFTGNILNFIASLYLQDNAALSQ